MNYDQYGQCWVTCDELVDLLYQDPDLQIDRFLVKDHVSHISQYNDSVKSLFAEIPKIKALREIKETVEEFDQLQQSHWHMPEEYKNMDIAQWVLDQCKSPAELQRAGEELLLYQVRDAMDLLRYLKYLVDTFRKNNVVWGLGRGSSVASFVLYLIGVHKINSLYYDLDITEFLR